MLDMLRVVAGGRLKPLSRHGAWILVGLTLLLVFAVRVRLLSTPLERDEGEYAYAGQLLLHGVPPYREAYNMKLPGTYAAYAAIMAVFGQTPSAIHFGLALVNMASIVLMFLLGRALLDEIAGVVAAVVFALLSLSPTILGFAGHATHFVALPALAGMYLLARGPWSAAGSQAGHNLRPAVRIKSPQTSGETSPARPSAGPGPADAGKPEAGKTPIPQAESPPGEAVVASRKPRTADPRRWSFFAGILLGVAFVMKQHGIFFGIFGGLYLLWCGASDFFEARAERNGPRARRASRFTPGASRFTFQASLIPLFLAGFLVPYGLTCLLLWLAGVFPQFWFWTVSYAGKYATALKVVYGPGFLRSALLVVVGPNLLLWLLPWTGALVMWWDERLEVRQRFFIAALLVCSFASVSVGFYFRQHYFILLLPAMAVLSGAAVSRSLRVLRRDKTLELFLAVPILGLFAFGVLAVLIGNGSMLFADAPDKIVQELYQSTLNLESVKAADYLKTHAPKDARVAVVGSEPQIYFGADRRSATGYIYMYPLMEPQPYAARMQEEMIAEIERARPEYAVYVDDDFSWRRDPDSLRKLDDWWKEYWPANYALAATFDIQESKDEAAALAPAANANGEPKRLLVLKRKN
jgi:4-amino-4-deoxy-L-arabinose transferase-like glycosyltransferase